MNENTPKQDINQIINICYNQIFNILNKYDLPIGCIYFIIKDIYNDIEKQYISYLNSKAIEQAQTINFNSQNNNSEENSSIGQE